MKPQCHWTHEHPPHEWYPMVPDPENERVLHLGLAAVQCPGIKEEKR